MDATQIFASLRRSPSDLSSFNQLLDLVEDYFEGVAPLETIQTAMEGVDRTLGMYRAEFEDGLRFQESTPALREYEDLVASSFGALQIQFQELTTALVEKRELDVATILRESQAFLNQLYFVFGALRDSQKDVHSKSPYVNELLRVGKGFLAQTIPLESFQERFETFYKFHYDFVKRVEDTNTSHAARLLEKLHAQSDALEDLAQFFDTSDVACVEPALGRLKTSTDRLLEIQAEFLAEPEPTQACLQCGQVNPVGARFCQACQGKMIDVGGPPETGGLFDAGGPELGPNLQKVFDAARKVREQNMTQAEFRAVVDWFGGLLETVIKQFTDMPEPTDKAIPEEQWTVYDKAVTTMEDGLSLFREAVDSLEEYCESQDPQVLEVALEKLLEAQDLAVALSRQNEEVTVAAE